MSPGESAAVATWYRSGWKRWWFRRSRTVTWTGRPPSARAAFSPAKPPPTITIRGAPAGGGVRRAFRRATAFAAAAAAAAPGAAAPVAVEQPSPVLVRDAGPRVADREDDRAAPRLVGDPHHPAAR